MRLSWIRVGLTNDWYPYKKWKHREKRMPPGDGVKDRKDGPISQGTPGFWQPSDGRRGMEHPLPLGSQEGTNSAYTLISDFWPPGPWKDRFPLFKATHFVVTYCGGPGELAWWLRHHCDALLFNMAACSTWRPSIRCLLGTFYAVT